MLSSGVCFLKIYAALSKAEHSFFFLFKNLFIFNWRRIALQYCFGFCHILNLEPIVQSEVSQEEENKAKHSLKTVVIYFLHWLDMVGFQWKSDRRGNVYSPCSHFWRHKKHCLETLRSALEDRQIMQWTGVRIWISKNLKARKFESWCYCDLLIPVGFEAWGNSG